MTPEDIVKAVIALRAESAGVIELQNLMEKADDFGIDTVGRVINEARFHAASLALAQRVWKLSHAAEGHCPYED